LGITFDTNFNGGRGLGEAFFETRMHSVIKDLQDKKILKVGEEGAQLVFFDNDEFPPLMIVKNDGATLYATRDLATDKYRLEKYNPDLVINEVGSEQGLYFKQLYETEKILGWYKEGQRVHVGHGLFLLDGKKMSTRAGKTVKLNEVLVEAIERAKKLGSEDGETAKSVGIGAIKYFDLSHQPLSNINFDWDRMFAMEGNSGPYIQYTIARTNSVLAKKMKLKGEALEPRNIVLNNEELSVMRSLVRFNEIISMSSKNYSPNILCNYLYDLAQKYNGFYNKHRIISEEGNVKDGEVETFRLQLTKATGQVLKNGLKLLGIESPEKM
jgi:arginyl-tRNA synthetase